MTDRTILAAKNSDVNRINDLATTFFPGESRTYLSTDSVICPKQNQNLPRRISK